MSKNERGRIKFGEMSQSLLSPDRNPAAAAQAAENAASAPAVIEESALPPSIETEPTPTLPAEAMHREGPKPTSDDTTQAPSKGKKTKKKEAEKVMKGIYFDAPLYPKLRSLCAEKNVPVSNFVNDAALSALIATYHCSDPGCRCKFTMRITDDPKPPVPKQCPVCGSSVTKTRI